MIEDVYMEQSIGFEKVSIKFSYGLKKILHWSKALLTSFKQFSHLKTWKIFITYSIWKYLVWNLPTCNETCQLVTKPIEKLMPRTVLLSYSDGNRNPTTIRDMNLGMRIMLQSRMEPDWKSRDECHRENLISSNNYKITKDLTFLLKNKLILLNEKKIQFIDPR